MTSIRAAITLSLLGATIAICNAQILGQPPAAPGHKPHFNDTLPECAINCAQTAATAVGCSFIDVLDPTCLCKSPTFLQATLQCAGKSCPIADQSTVSEVFTTLCSQTSTFTLSPSTTVSIITVSTISKHNRTSTATDTIIATTVPSVTSSPISTTSITVPIPTISSVPSVNITSITSSSGSLTPITTITTPLPATSPLSESTTVVVATDTAPITPQTTTPSGDLRLHSVPGQLFQLSFIVMAIWTSTMMFL